MHQVGIIEVDLGEDKTEDKREKRDDGISEQNCTCIQPLFILPHAFVLIDLSGQWLKP